MSTRELKRSTVADTKLKPSRTLLSAALCGLTCAGLFACGSSDDEPKTNHNMSGVVTSETPAPDMTLEKFTAECTARGGTVEMHSHCGGMNSCKGMSYDESTGVLMEHTCMGLNTCAGYSCVVPS